MHRPAGETVPAQPLEAGWRWVSLDERRVEEAHAAIAAAFGDVPSFGLSPLPDFRRAVAAGPDLWQALLDDERIVSLLRVLPGEAGTGKIGMLGRIPSHRGRGLGPRLLARALRLLAEHGSRDVTLDVEAANADALGLYQRFGFHVATRTPVFGLALRST